jgi:hypothetical protein
MVCSKAANNGRTYTDPKAELFANIKNLVENEPSDFEKFMQALFDSEEPDNTPEEATPEEPSTDELSEEEKFLQFMDRMLREQYGIDTEHDNKPCECTSNKKSSCKSCSKPSKPAKSTEPEQPESNASESEDVYGYIGIDRVLYHDNATIIFFDDNTKTVAICDDEDEFNPSAGFAIALCKKLFGNATMHDMLNTYCREEYDKREAAKKANNETVYVVHQDGTLEKKTSKASKPASKSTKSATKSTKSKTTKTSNSSKKK